MSLQILCQNRKAMHRIWAYERDPYQRVLDTHIVAGGQEEDRAFVLLEDTIFYPGGGGQPSDVGSVNEVEIGEVRRAGTELRHYVGGATKPGPARLELDWGRRFDHMQQHTAQHLLTATALDGYGWQTTAFHLGAQRCDIELATSDVRIEDLETLEEAAVAAIRASRAVTSRRVAPEEYARLDVRSRGLPAGYHGDVRLVEIEGLDLNTCGGTHVASTAELESLKLLACEPMRGGTRLFWLAGGRVRRLLAANESRNARLRGLFECGDEDLVGVASSRVARLGQSQRRVRELEERLAGAAAETLVQRSERVLEAHFDGLGADYLREVARRVTNKAPGRVAFLTATADEDKFFLVAAGEHCSVDVQSIGRRVAELLAGRGGGSKGMFQGRAGSLESRGEVVKLLERHLEP